jgi:hypothetical protein
MPAGQRAYLRRLRCANDTPPTFAREGSFGSRTTPHDAAAEQIAFAQMSRSPAADEPDYHVLDRYTVTCPDRTRSLYLDMYHCDSVPTEAVPPGLTLAPPPPANAPSPGPSQSPSPREGGGVGWGSH